MTDVMAVAKDILDLSQRRPEKQVYMSLPRPGVSTLKLIILAGVKYFNCFTSKTHDVAYARHNKKTIYDVFKDMLLQLTGCLNFL